MKIIAMLGLMALSSGCAGIMEFNTPKEFKGEKVKEDPPGTLLPVNTGVKTC